MEFFDGITFDIAKQKYYNANKVDARMAEIKAAFAELIEENNELRRQIPIACCGAIQSGDKGGRLFLEGGIQLSSGPFSAGG